VNALVKEGEGLCLTMHSQEIITSILENKPKNSSDIFAVLLVVASLHQLLPGFLKSFLPELWKPIKSFVSSPELTDRNHMSKFRWLFRVAIELHVAKSYAGLGQITSSLQTLVSEQKRAHNVLKFIVTHKGRTSSEAASSCYILGQKSFRADKAQRD
jgi:hypothetical protein